LLLGTYTADVSFTDLGNGFNQARQFNLLVGNGGFETGDFTDWTMAAETDPNFIDSVDATQELGSSSLPGVDDSLFVHSGIYGAFLGQTNSLGFLSQTLPTIPGQRYVVSFWLANPAQGTPNEFRATWNGSMLFDQVDMDQFAWTNLQFVVSATGTSTTLQFGFQNDQNAFGLDDISVQPVPGLAFQPVHRAQDTIVLTWSALSGITYQIQYTADLNAPNWTNLGAPVTATEGTVTVSDAITTLPQRFYRIVQLP
jgi:hypothetical protein